MNESLMVSDRARISGVTVADFSLGCLKIAVDKWKLHCVHRADASTIYR